MTEHDNTSLSTRSRKPTESLLMKPEQLVIAGVTLDSPPNHTKHQNNMMTNNRANNKTSMHDDHSAELMTLQEQSPAYKILHDHKLLSTSFRCRDVSDIDVTEANSTQGANLARQTVLYGAMCLPGCVDSVFNTYFTVPDGFIRPAEDGNGGYFFFGPGVHKHNNMFMKLGNDCIALTQRVIRHGNRTIVTVPQGSIGFCMDRGQPVLLSPGMHQWTSNTMEFQKNLDLSQHVIDMGPYCLLTVDEGYAAVTQDNGQQKILDGGQTYMLTHRNWRFEKFLTCKIQTNDLPMIRASTADNIILDTSANVNWTINDVALAAKMAAETMRPDGTPVKGEDIAKLRQDVLQQATASVAAFVGKVRYSDSSAVSALNARGSGSNAASSGGMGGAGFLFDADKLTSAVGHANDITAKYGITILSINIISAFPADRKLMEALAAGAVAAAEAEQAELAAQGRGKALFIDSQAEADAERVRAQGAADAEKTRAEGSRAAARLLEDSQVAVQLAKIRETGLALSEKTPIFFGAGGGDMSALLSNPGVFSTK